MTALAESPPQEPPQPSSRRSMLPDSNTMLPRVSESPEVTEGSSDAASSSSPPLSTEEPEKGAVVAERALSPSSALQFPTDISDDEVCQDAAAVVAQVFAAAAPQVNNAVVESVAHYVHARTAGSPFFRANPAKALPVFDTNEITLGNLLGQGEFGSVREVQEITNKAGRDSLPRLMKASLDSGAFLNESSHITTGRRGHNPKSGNMSAPLLSVGDASGYFYEEVAAFDHDNNNNSGDDEQDDAKGKNDSDDNASIELVPDVEAVQRARRVLKKRCWRDGKARYAVKQLRKELLQKVLFEEASGDYQLGTIGAMDLAMEATLLASLSHPNICKLRGTAGTPGSPEYMLVLDRLYITLDDKIDDWREEQPSPNRMRQLMDFGGAAMKLPKLHFPKSFPKKRVSEGDGANARRPRNKAYDSKSNVDLVIRKGQLLHRLYAAYDVARALRYLHQNKIVFRDLKPQNIAFDIRGDVRIFDFGLAKELLETDLVKFPDDYNATGMCGSRRWMAPEVYFSEPYGLSADTYSFGLLLWNLCYLRTPFGDGLTLKSHHKKVMVKGDRPKRLRSKIVSESLWHLMSMCWTSEREERPSFENICEALRNDISNLRIDIQTTVGMDATNTTAAETSTSFRKRNATTPSSSSSSFGRRQLLSRSGSVPRFFFGTRQHSSAKVLENPVNVSWHHRGHGKAVTRARRGRGKQNHHGRPGLKDFQLRNSDLEDRSDYLLNKSLQSMAMLLSSKNLRSSNATNARSSSSSNVYSSHGSRMNLFGSHNHHNSPGGHGPGTSQIRLPFGESVHSMGATV
ncbi:Probable LIM domain-containing serine/threonine-protein kinase DDB [Seminavis robusta]|uniref:Probable LIM domain-containing serine/threonine-protein kinase DDB n=1 Tax=Seminavis robusta TaxID=568900 RepID=A0A9N8ECZ4_9STRA|nr:Probable LIM domain-containing serine/threonine-protein kinase DDB [Seminavis robusta]|eukprot:Sro770_g200050.1 Probable LIM domain-containing serine/threonine-protein kinase DDB (801) ;mRNA; r:38963-41551